MESPTYQEVKSTLHEALKKLSLYYRPDFKIIGAIEDDLERIDEYERWYSKEYPLVDFNQESFTLNEKKALDLSEISHGILQVNELYGFYL